MNMYMNISDLLVFFDAHTCSIWCDQLKIILFRHFQYISNIKNFKNIIVPTFIAIFTQNRAHARCTPIVDNFG